MTKVWYVGYFAISLFRIYGLFFPHFCHSSFFGQIWSQNLKFSKLTEIWYRLHCYMLFTILMFIFSKNFVTHAFGQIWSHDLDFFKFTEISWRGTLLYAYYDFNVYFFKIFLSHIFLDKFAPKICCFQLKFRTGVHYYMLLTTVMFIFPKLCHSYNFGQIWSKNLMLSKLNEICYKGTLLYTDYGFDVKFFEVFSVHICSPYILKFSIEIRCNSVNSEKTRWNEIYP